MERIVTLHVERLPEGVYLATSESLPGLVAQGRTLTETLEIARDVARKLIEARTERNEDLGGIDPVSQAFDFPLVVGG